MEHQEGKPGDLTDSGQFLEAGKAIQQELQTLLASAKQLQSSLADVVAATQLEANNVAEIGTAATASKSQINDLQAVIATKSSHIQDAQIHADKVRAELDRLQTAATQQATEAEGERSRAKSAADAVAELLAEIRVTKASAEGDSTSTAASRDEAKSAAAISKALAEKAESVEKKLKGYEEELESLDERAKAQLETIISLLPGATAAGLAHAFNDRRQTFLKPATRWQWLFVGSLVLLIALAASGLWTVYRDGVILAWDDLARVWAARLPIAGALVWLALHASTESALAKRLEEDYGYKAAIAASFLGFQKQMAEIGSSVQSASPLSKLCDDTVSFPVK